jgi:hypothetical protein
VDGEDATGQHGQSHRPQLRACSVWNRAILQARGTSRTGFHGEQLNRLVEAFQ